MRRGFYIGFISICAFLIFYGKLRAAIDTPSPSCTAIEYIARGDATYFELQCPGKVRVEVRGDTILIKRK